MYIVSLYLENFYFLLLLRFALYNLFLNMFICCFQFNISSIKAPNIFYNRYSISSVIMNSNGKITCHFSIIEQHVITFGNIHDNVLISNHNFSLINSILTVFAYLAYYHLNKRHWYHMQNNQCKYFRHLNYIIYI